MTGSTFQHKSTTAAAPDAVWEALDEPRTWEAIPGVDRVFDPILDASGRLRGFSFETSIGGKTFPGEARPADRVEEKLMAWMIRASELEGKVSVALTSTGDATGVEVRLQVEPLGMLGSLFFPVIASAIGGRFAETVDEFVAGLDHR